MSSVVNSTQRDQAGSVVSDGNQMHAVLFFCPYYSAADFTPSGFCTSSLIVTGKAEPSGFNYGRKGPTESRVQFRCKGALF